MLRKSIYKSPAQLRLMVEPGLATAASLVAARSALRVGGTTAEVDAAAEAAIVALGGASNFQLEPGYLHTICASVNEDVVHGIPNDRRLEPGDIVSIDSGAVVGGWNGDAAFSVVLPDPARPELVADPEEVVTRLLKRAAEQGRADDTEEVIRHRQDVYHEQTEPVIAAYKDRGIVVEVDGLGPVEEVSDRVRAALTGHGIAF